MLLTVTVIITGDGVKLYTFLFFTF